MSTVDLTAEFARLTDEAVKLREERNTLRGEIKELKAQHQERIERLIEANHPRIQAILAAYGVPQLDEQGRLMAVPADPSLTRSGAGPAK